MSPPVKPLCSKDRHPRTLEFGSRDAHSRWRCRLCKTERNARERARWAAREAARGRAPLADTTRCDCGLLLARHPRCRGCDILVGPTHLETKRYAGRCASCVDFLARHGLGRAS